MAHAQEAWSLSSHVALPPLPHGIGSQLPTPLIPGALASPSLPLPTAASWPQLTSAPGERIKCGRVWIGLEPHCISGKGEAVAVPTRGWQVPSAFSRQLVWGL